MCFMKFKINFKDFKEDKRASGSPDAKIQPTMNIFEIKLVALF